MSTSGTVSEETIPGPILKSHLAIFETITTNISLGEKIV